MISVLPKSTEQNLELLRLLYHVNITAVCEPQTVEAFSARFRFHPLQHLFSADVLFQLIRKVQDTQVYLLTDAFMVRAALFYLDGVPVILGPFTSVLLRERDVSALFRRFPLPDVTEDAVLHYVNSFPCIPETDVLRLITSLLRVLFPEEPAREIVAMNYFETAETETADSFVGKRENQTRLLETRYAYEYAFIQAIMEGNARKAIQEMGNMQQDVAYLKRIGTMMETERIGAAIVRTTARLAARQAGLPAVILDRIATENTVAVIHAQKPEEIFKAQEVMIRNYCRAVRNYRSESHSALVQSALYCIEKEYAGEMTVQSLARELDVSPNYLISLFKKELQTTPNVYLRRVRLRQAARLLEATDQSVQEIASRVGIPDANYMIKLFRAQYGETPTVYRRKYRV